MPGVCASPTREHVQTHAPHTHHTRVLLAMPSSAVPLWFTSELNGKDHIENTHHFREGRVYSFYECLRKFGLEWFASRQLFSEKTTTGQSLWTDIALARHSGQELNNSFIVTWSPDFTPLRRFFVTVVAALQSRYDAMTARDYPLPMPQTRSPGFDALDMYQHLSTPEACQSPVLDFPADESPVDLLAHACKPQFTDPADWGSGITVCTCALVACCCTGDMHSQHRFTHIYRPATDGSASITQSSYCS